KVQREEVGLDELDVRGDVAPGGGQPPTGAFEHRRVEIDTDDRVAGSGQGLGEAAAADAELEDRAARPAGKGKVEILVAGVVEEVDVVEPGEGAGLSRRLGHAPRTAR